MCRKIIPLAGRQAISYTHSRCVAAETKAKWERERQKLQLSAGPCSFAFGALRYLKINFVVQVFRRYLTFCGIGIQNAQLFEMSVMEYRRNQVSC